MSVRLKIAVRGAVQGVGFRPFAYRLATALGLCGWVKNSAQGVFLEVEGPRPDLETFLLRLEAEKPPRSFIQSLEASWLDPVGYASFEIRLSEAGGARTALVLPDVATCPDCVRDVFDPGNRRYFYPFTNCTNCGPRFSIIEALPYDRPNTSMKRFAMCPQCQAEYDDPHNRRFHAQPNACPECGPRLELWDHAGRVLSGPDPRGQTTGELLAAAAQAIREGKIVAVKGLGGFHLMVAAQNDPAVRRLRKLKHREEKPLALMFPSVEAVRAVSEVSPLEERLFRSPEAPIVLLKRIAHPRLPIADSVAPGNPNLGIMLPYTPLHHLLLSLLGAPVIATSGNLSDEPICTDEHEAVERLGGIADLFLVHNRPIVRHVDDSIARVMLGRELVLRRARGYAPLPVQLAPLAGEGKQGTEKVILAVGAHLKNTIALGLGPQVFLSQHIGDLETDQAYEAFRRVIADFERLYDSRPSVIAADAHPDYLSTRFARELVGQASPPASPAGVPARSSEYQNPQLVSVQHHAAHVLSCMAENELEPPVLGVSWDGTGYGLDGTVWGGEFFIVTTTACERAAHLRQFRLPGGDRAVKEPRRTALGLLNELFGEVAFAMKELAPVRAFSPRELASLKTMLTRKLNSPLTSSVGRLFDGVAALIGLRQQVHFEGQAAMELEFAIESSEVREFYPFRAVELRDLDPQDEVERGAHPSRVPFSTSSRKTPSAQSGSPLSHSHERDDVLDAGRVQQRPRRACSPTRFFGSKQPLTGALILDWSPVLEGILRDLAAKVSVAEISTRFHNGLAEAIVAVAQHAAQPRVALSGGCFQNRYLTERTVERLRAEGFLPYWHQRVPPNDGGISLGQVVAALRQERLHPSS